MKEPLIAVVDDARFDQHRASGPHPERPERLVAARRGLRGVLPPENQALVEARRVTNEEVLRVHSESYVKGLRARMQTGSGWGHIDGDTFFSPDSEDAAWRAAGAAVDLCRRVIEGPTRRGIALLRPPGHHAGPAQAMGFCLLNNVAIAAADAVSNGLRRIAVLDWDVHHGNGTQDIFYEDEHVLFISLHESPLYPGTGGLGERGHAAGEGYTINLPMPAGSSPNVYGAAFREVVLPVLDAFQAELVLVSAGFDAHQRDPLASLELDGACFAAMTTALTRHVHALGHGRIALFLEGGYDLDGLEESIAAVTRSLLGEEVELASGPLSPREEQALFAAKHSARRHWPVS